MGSLEYESSVISTGKVFEKGFLPRYTIERRDSGAKLGSLLNGKHLVRSSGSSYRFAKTAKCLSRKYKFHIN